MEAPATPLGPPQNIVSEATRAIIAEYAAKWAPASAPSGSASGGGGGRMRAYVKPREGGDYIVAGRKARDCSSGTDGKATAPPPVTAGAGAAGSSTKKSRRGRAVELAELGAGRALLPRHGPCECQASATAWSPIASPAVVSCEGEGPCETCGALVLCKGSSYAGLDEQALLPPELASEAEAKAIAFKDRLVEYDRTAARRTEVIDDQSDYFQIDSNAWLSEEEKLQLQKRQEDMERTEEERKRRVVVTFDLLGRKVVMAESEQLGDVAEEAAQLSTSTSNGATQDLSMRVKPSPSLCIPPPIFVDVRALGKSHTQTTKAEGAVKSSGAVSGVGRGPSERSWMRVQHDDPFAEAVGVISQEASLSKAAGATAAEA
eukprot:SM000011S19037  [mRNA]  locus=s11:558565:560590:+ [translate_table: standard]